MFDFLAQVVLELCEILPVFQKIYWKPSVPSEDDVIINKEGQIRNQHQKSVQKKTRTKLFGDMVKK